MIRMRQGNTIVLGIDEENVKRLKEDQPIKVDGEPLGINCDIYIVYGKTLDEIMPKITGPTH